MLMELLFGAAILAFVITGLLTVFFGCLFLNEASRNLSLATSHAHYALETIKDAQFIDLTDGSWNVTWNATDLTQRQMTPLNNETLAVNVSGTSLLNVTVTVNWKDRGIRNISQVFNTLVAER